jgi:hypothetical protein
LIFVAVRADRGLKVLVNADYSLALPIAKARASQVSKAALEISTSRPANNGNNLNWKSARFLPRMGPDGHPLTWAAVSLFDGSPFGPVVPSDQG